MPFTLVNESIDLYKSKHTCTMYGIHNAHWVLCAILHGFMVAPSIFSTAHHCDVFLGLSVYYMISALRIFNFVDIQSNRMNSLNSIIVLLLLLHSFGNGMSKRIAGLVVFRRVNAQIEYLMLRPSKSGKSWSPPKGHPFISILYFKLRKTIEQYIIISYVSM